MKDKDVNPEVLEREIFESLGVRTDIYALCRHIEKKFMPELRERIEKDFLARPKILLVFKCDFGNGQISAELFAQAAMVDQIVEEIAKGSTIDPSDTNTSMTIWNLEHEIIPSFMLFYHNESENAVVSSARWGLKEDVFADKNKN